MTEQTFNQKRDAHLLSLDFIQGTGVIIASFALAVAAAASAERVDILEVALRQCRAALLDAISEFKRIKAVDAKTDGGARDR